MLGEARAGAEKVSDLLVVMKQATKGKTGKTDFLGSAQSGRAADEVSSP